MKRSFLAFFAGVVAWVVVASIINRLLRLGLPGYRAAEPVHAYTLTMKWARLTMAIVTSLSAGAMTRWVAPASRWTPLVLGGVLLALFLPLHVSIWSQYPVWYHLTFLLTIIPAVLLGDLLAKSHAR